MNDKERLTYLLLVIYKEITQLIKIKDLQEIFYNREENKTHEKRLGHFLLHDTFIQSELT